MLGSSAALISPIELPQSYSMIPKKIYLAGPDVFLPDANAHFKAVAEILALHGLAAVVPSDGGLSGGAPCNPATAHRIFEGNIALMRGADALLVNLNAFRGTEPDSGTCFEVGFAYALGIPIVAYVDCDELYADRVARICGVAPGSVAPSRFDAQERCLIEDMGLPLNLMLAFSANLVTTGLSAAIALLSTQWRAP